MMIVNPGSLKHKIEFFSNITTTDSEGFKSNTPTSILVTKCAITRNEFLDKSKISSGNVDASKTEITCIVRFSNSINENCTVSLYGEQYKIVSMKNINFENRFLEIGLKDVQ